MDSELKREIIMEHYQNPINRKIINNSTDNCRAVLILSFIISAVSSTLLEQDRSHPR